MKLENVCTNCQKVWMGHTMIVFSYGTPVLARWGGHYFRLWDGWSATTSRHISKAIGQTIRKQDWEAMPVEDANKFRCYF